MNGSIRVLVLEDQPLIAMDLEDLLSSRGYDVIGPEATVSEALASLARATPDAALLDIDLGGETSFVVGEELLRRDVPFVFATGSVVDDALPEALRGVTVIQKPWNVEDVLAFLAAATASGH